MEESAGVDLPVAVCVYVPAGVGEALSSLLAGLLLDRGVAVQFVLLSPTLPCCHVNVKNRSS